MVKVTLQDGSQKKFGNGVTGFEIAEEISLSLSKNAVAMLVDGVQRDLSDTLEKDATVSIITLKDEIGLDIMRHTLTAQVLAKAIKNLFPDSMLAIGPTIENGFYYDVLFKKPISSDDLPRIEDEMKKIIKGGSDIKKIIKKKDDVVSLFKDLKEPYKIKIINESSQNENFQIYQQTNSNFIDFVQGATSSKLKTYW